MHDSAHRVRVLTAIIENAAATPGEVAAARAALAVHMKRCGATAPSSVADAGVPERAQARRLAGTPRDVLLVYQDNRWTLVVDDVIVDEWPGDGEINFDPPKHERFGDTWYVSSSPRLVRIYARVADLAFDEHLKHGPVRVVIEAGPATWLFDARYEGCGISWSAHHTLWRSRDADSQAWTRFEFVGMHHSTLFKTTSAACADAPHDAALTARPIRAIQAR